MENERDDLFARAVAVGLKLAKNTSTERLKKLVEEAEAKKASGGAPQETEPEDPDFAVVKGPQRGRYRIGRHFTREETVIPLENLTEGELTALRNDPELMVTLR